MSQRGYGAFQPFVKSGKNILKGCKFSDLVYNYCIGSLDDILSSLIHDDVIK